MSQAIASNPAEKGDMAFSAAEYFLGIAQRIASSGENTQVALPGVGEVSLFPGRKEFSATIPDMAEFFSAPAAQFRITPLGAGAAPQAADRPRNMEDLFWQAGFHASQGRLVEGTSKYDIVQFRHWPNLPRLSKTANTARVCALLTRHPTTITLVHRQLDIDKEEVYRVYSAAYSAGIASIRNLESTTNFRALDSATAEADLATDNAPAAQTQGLFRALFSKISGL